MTTLEKAPLPATPSAAQTYEESRKWAETLARTQLVPKPLQGNADAIMLVTAMGTELGMSFVVATQNIDIIESRPTPNAQSRLGQIRRHGHEARFEVATSERALLRARRRENQHDPNAWVEVEWTLDKAERAGYLDEWVEWPYRRDGDRYDRWMRFKLRREGNEYVPKDFGAEMPEKATAEIKAGRVKRRDNWWTRPDAMLRARCATDMYRMEFSDLLFASGVDPYTAEEQGYDGGSDADPTNDDDEIVDAELVDTDVARPSEGPATEPDGAGARTTADQHADPSARPDPDWKARARDAGVSVGELMRRAQAIASELGIALPSSVGALIDEELCDRLGRWLAEQGA